ncbi:MAG: STM3941 family protein [Flavobacterium sp.]
METIEIPFSKKKNFLALIGSLLFVILGILFVNNPAEFESKRGSKEIIFTVGIISLIFFGLAAILAIKNLFSKKSGLIINQDGFISHPEHRMSLHVLWDDVIGMSVDTVSNQKFISVHIQSPDDFILNQKNFVKRNLLLMTKNRVGTPISISANPFKISHKELHSLLQDRFDKYKQTQNQSTLQ